MIDGVIRGEGEIPFVEYCKAITQNGSLESVPNLTYRNSSQHVKVNPISYVASNLDDLNFTNISLMHNGKRYVEENRDIMKMPFNLCMARSCPFSCPYCGGGRESQKILSKRTKVIFRSPEKLIEDLHDLFSKYKAGGVFFGHGTYPANFKYWKTIFKMIRREKFDMGGDLEIWRSPFPREMWIEFYKTFDRNHSSISLCPERHRCAFNRKFSKSAIPPSISRLIISTTQLRTPIGSEPNCGSGSRSVIPFKNWGI